ncbi:hypothetical protein [Sphingomonas flavalba]|uniref:hypothetical protein n=1 Tax=Sphingomonas flavalba TaxID=2559804 RepID=UPI00109DB5FD|nr:hypothetical protein [Sphingomonas flavalba]
MATSFPGRLKDDRWAGTRMSTWPILLALTAIAVGIQLSGVPNHDVAWILTSAGRLLDGGRFGRDIVDVNPPLAWWVLAVPVAIADSGGWPRYPIFVACVAALTLASVRLTEVTLRHGGGGEAGRRVVLAAAAALLFVPGYDYGQREHLLLIAALPYCMAAAVASRARPIPPGLSLVIGLLAAIGFCLKPYFLIIPAALALWVLLRTGKLSALPHRSAGPGRCRMPLCGGRRGVGAGLSAQRRARRRCRLLGI